MLRILLDKYIKTSLDFVLALHKQKTKNIKIEDLFARFDDSVL